MNKFFIRFFDILFSLSGLIILLPLFILFSVAILIDSRGPVFYRQSRVGKYDRDFLLWKFRTMKTGSDKEGLLTVGSKDSRITRFGYFLRRFKLDELPQLINVMSGEMSLVGPRPEVRKYVDLYTDEQRRVLFVKPGITDLASLSYYDENDMLAQSEDPDKMYIEVIMPAKISINLKFIKDPTLKNYFTTIFKTIGKIIRSGH